MYIIVVSAIIAPVARQDRLPGQPALLSDASGRSRAPLLSPARRGIKQQSASDQASDGKSEGDTHGKGNLADPACMADAARLGTRDGLFGARLCARARRRAGTRAVGTEERGERSSRRPQRPRQGHQSVVANKPEHPMSRPTVYGHSAHLHVRALLFALAEKEVVFRVQPQDALPLLGAAPDQLFGEPVLDVGGHFVQGPETTLR